MTSPSLRDVCALYGLSAGLAACGIVSGCVELPLGGVGGTRDLQPPRGGPGNISHALKESSLELALADLELADG